MTNYKLPNNYQLYCFDELESTMLTLREMVLNGAGVGTIVLAKKQNNGRGRHGREWVSPLGNLYFSFIRKAEEKKSKNVFASVFVVSVALARTISIISGDLIKPILKWPNDVLINNSKVSGILIENFFDNEKNNLLNIGIGINIISSPLNTVYSATNLKKEGIEVSANDVLLCFFNSLNYFENILVNKGIEEIFKIWNKYSFKKGTKISVKMGNKNIVGSYNGIDNKGSLLLKVDGIDTKIFTGEVFVL